MNLSLLEEQINNAVKRWNAANRDFTKEWEASQTSLAEGKITPETRQELVTTIQTLQREFYETEFEPLIEKIIGYYVEATPPERKSIRKMSGRHSSFTTILHDFAYINIARCQTPNDGGHFQRALLAVSIEDAATDFRDTTLTLEHIRDVARRVGIATAPYAARVAALSSDERNTGSRSMKDWIEGMFVRNQHG